MTSIQDILKSIKEIVPADGVLLEGVASFDEAETSGVITPFSAGCGSVVEYPYLEKASKTPRCVIGMFDPSARPFVPKTIHGS